MSTSSRVYLVTGATQGIGLGIARGLANTPNSEVIIVGRNEEKARSVVAELKKSTGNQKISYEIVELGSYKSIVSFGKRFRDSGRKLHALVNNVGVGSSTRKQSADGIELQFAVNVLSYYWVIQELLPVLKSSAPSRIVNVASFAAGDLRLDDLELNVRGYDGRLAYRQSKQADRVLTLGLAEQLRSSGIIVNSCHPGVVDTTLADDLGVKTFLPPDTVFDTAEKASRTPILLAASAATANVTGKYFVAEKEAEEPFANDKATIEGLLKSLNKITAELKHKYSLD